MEEEDALHRSGLEIRNQALKVETDDVLVVVTVLELPKHMLLVTC